MTRILVLLLLLAAAVLGGVVVRYVLVSPSGSSQYIREIIGIPDPPETVALHWMQACQQGDAKQIADLVLQDWLSALLNRAALNDPPLSPEKILNDFAERQKNELKDATFEIEEDPFFTKHERSVCYSVRILYPDQSLKVIHLLMKKERGSDHWKCAGVEQ